MKCFSLVPPKCPIELHPSNGQPFSSSGCESFDKFKLCFCSIFLCFDFPLVGISEGTFFTGLFVVERFIDMLSSVSVSDLIDVVPRCFDFRVLLVRTDLRLGLASFALSESESEFEEAADDESVEVDDAEEASFFTSGLGFSGVTLGAGFGGAPGSGYFLGLPRPRPDVELPDCLRMSFTGGGTGFSSSDSDEFEKMLLSFLTLDIAGGASFLGVV